MKVYNQSCKNCLLSPDAIVSPKRRIEILNDCKRNQSHFICHKASMNDEDICCKRFYDSFGHFSQLVRISERLGAIDFVDQTDNTKLVSHKEMNK